MAGEFLICFDFAENYAFVVQNSAQSFHWNNDQDNNFKPKKMYYFADGSGHQFKNKSSFANLQALEEDFDMPAEWRLHGTAHGHSTAKVRVMA